MDLTLIDSLCRGLYIIGWDNMDAIAQFDYVLICKPLGWL